MCETSDMFKRDSLYKGFKNSTTSVASGSVHAVSVKVIVTQPSCQGKPIAENSSIIGYEMGVGIGKAEINTDDLHDFEKQITLTNGLDRY